MANPVHFLALGFGSGLAPKAPGTFGTLAALPLVWLMSAYTPFITYLVITALTCVVGVWICGKTARDMHVHDDSSIVWDEIAGMMITMIAVPLTWQYLLAGFVLFRLFDIVKPWPIKYLDRQVHGGLGIMLDDILAGLCSLGLLHLYMAF
jgi:phosphatidylglycerophosphatase A